MKLPKGYVKREDIFPLLRALEGVIDSWTTVYSHEHDEIGSKSCCGVVSYAPHTADCLIKKAREAIVNFEKHLKQNET